MGIGSILGGLAGSFFGGPVGGAVGGSIGGMIDGSSSKSKSSGSQQTASSNPDWVNKASQETYDRARQLSGQPYVPYFDEEKYLSENQDVADSGMSALEHYTKYGQAEGRDITELSRVAEFDPNYQSASNLANSQVGRFDGDYATIEQLLKDSSNPYGQTYNPNEVTARDVSGMKWTDADVNSYMNPYLEAALKPQEDALKQDYAIRQNQANAKAAGSGSFGGSRAGINSALITGQEQDKLNTVRSTGYNDAYNTALAAFNNDANRDLTAQTSNQSKDINLGKYNEDQALDAFEANYTVYDQDRDAAQAAANQLQNLVNTKSGVTNDIIANLVKTGAVNQTQEQAVISDEYARFMEEQGYPKEMITYLNDLLKSSASVGNVTTAPAPKNGLAQTIGSGLQIAGMFGDTLGSLGSSGGSNSWVDPDTGNTVANASGSTGGLFNLFG